MVLLTTLLALVVGVADTRALRRDVDRRHRVLAGGLTLLLTALLIWQLATEPSGLDRLGWTSVQVEAGRSGQALVVVLLATLVLAAALQVITSRVAWSTTVTRAAAALGLIGAVGSMVTAYTCFVE